MYEMSALFLLKDIYVPKTVVKVVYNKKASTNNKKETEKQILIFKGGLWKKFIIQKLFLSVE